MEKKNKRGMPIVFGRAIKHNIPRCENCGTRDYTFFRNKKVCAKCYHPYNKPIK